MAVDVVKAKVDLINSRKSPIVDKEVEEYLANKELDLVAILDGDIAYKESEIVIIATPTNYDSDTNKFDISSVANRYDSSLDDVKDKVYTRDLLRGLLKNLKGE